MEVRINNIHWIEQFFNWKILFITIDCVFSSRGNRERLYERRRPSWRQWWPCYRENVHFYRSEQMKVGKSQIYVGGQSSRSLKRESWCRSGVTVLLAINGFLFWPEFESSTFLSQETSWPADSRVLQLFFDVATAGSLSFHLVVMTPRIVTVNFAVY